MFLYSGHPSYYAPQMSLSENCVSAAQFSCPLHGFCIAAVCICSSVSIKVSKMRCKSWKRPHNSTWMGIMVWNIYAKEHSHSPSRCGFVKQKKKSATFNRHQQIQIDGDGECNRRKCKESNGAIEMAIEKRAEKLHTKSTKKKRKHSQCQRQNGLRKWQTNGKTTSLFTYCTMNAMRIHYFLFSILVGLCEIFRHGLCPVHRLSPINGAGTLHCTGNHKRMAMMTTITLEINKEIAIE